MNHRTVEGNRMTRTQRSRSDRRYSAGTIAGARLVVHLSDRLGEPVSDRLREIASGHAVPGESGADDVPAANADAARSDGTEPAHEPS